MKLTQHQVFQRGFNAGQAASACVSTSPKTNLDDFTAEAHEAEGNARQYTPFEFLAKQINDSPAPEDLWDAYEQGVSSGIAAAAKARP